MNYFCLTNSTLEKGVKVLDVDNQMFTMKNSDIYLHAVLFWF